MRYVLILALSVSACAPAEPPEFGDAQRGAVSQEVQARIEGYCDAVLSKDLQYLAGFWANVPAFTLAGPSEGVMTEYRQIYDATEAWFDAAAEILHCEMSNTHVYVLGPDAASVTTEYAWGFLTAAGDTVNARGGWTYVFDRIQGELRVVHSSGNREMM
jgi:ketosteroid isomerase-like protein